jgi:outer membrane protein assembly factor BamB
VANGLVYVSDTGDLYALDATTGALIWQYEVNGQAQYGSPTIVNNVVYLTASDKNVYALNATTGKLIWKYATAGQIFTAPAVANGVLYVSSGASIVYALDAGTGVLIWTKQFGSSIGPPKSLSGSEGGQAVANGVLYVEVLRSAQTYDLYALDAGTGAVLWRSPSVGSALSTPAAANGVVYVARGDLISALNAATGVPLWQTEVYGGAHAPTVANGVVYVGSWYLIGMETGNGTNTALDASNGSSL